VPGPHEAEPLLDERLPERCVYARFVAGCTAAARWLLSRFAEVKELPLA